VEVGIGAAHEKSPSLTTGGPTTISANRQNRPLSAGMPLVEGVGGPILPEDCPGQNQKRKFVVLLLHRIAASLVLPQLLVRKGVIRGLPDVRDGRTREAN